MAIRLLSITHKMPAWIEAGYTTYASRLRSPFNLQLLAIPAEKRGVNADIHRIVEKEGEKILTAIKPHHYVIALDNLGSLWTTEQLSEKLTSIIEGGRILDLIVGGPDGLSATVRRRADALWSLSPLTFPHHLVRIIVAEQIFRAASIYHKHPYHR